MDNTPSKAEKQKEYSRKYYASPKGQATIKRHYQAAKEYQKTEKCKEYKRKWWLKKQTEKNKPPPID